MRLPVAGTDAAGSGGRPADGSGQAGDNRREPRFDPSGQHPAGRLHRPQPMPRPFVAAGRGRPGIEATVGAVVVFVVERQPKVVGRIRVARFRCLLGRRALGSEHTVEHPGGELVAEHRSGRARGHPVLAFRTLGGEQDGAGDELGLMDGGTGCARRGRPDRTQSNCGVFAAGSITCVRRMPLRSAMSSHLTDSENPWIACFAPH